MPRELAAGRYRVVRLVAHAAMTDVYEVVHAELGKRCIAKVLRKPFSVDPRLSKALHNEGRALAALKHPNLVEVVDYGLDPVGPFLVLEYLEGETLATLLKREGKLPRERALRLMLGFLEALVLVHKAGVVHRNISPEALYVTRDPELGERLKLLDFGFARNVDAEQVTHTEVNPLALSVPYLALEQLVDSASADARADVYAAAAVLLAMLTGKAPHADSTLQQRLVAGEELAVPSLPADLPERMAQGLRKALATRAADRLPDAAALHEMIDPDQAADDEATWVEAAPGAITEPRGIRAFDSQKLRVSTSDKVVTSGIISSAPAPDDSAPTTVKSMVDENAPTTVKSMVDENAPTTIKKVITEGGSSPAVARVDHTEQVDVLPVATTVAKPQKPVSPPPAGSRRVLFLVPVLLIAVVATAAYVIQRERHVSLDVEPDHPPPGPATPSKVPAAVEQPALPPPSATLDAGIVDASAPSADLAVGRVPPELVHAAPEPARAAPEPARPPRAPTPVATTRPSASRPVRAARPSRPTGERRAPARPAAAKTKEGAPLFGGDDL
jgi:serine/threonine protein kinase